MGLRRWWRTRHVDVEALQEALRIERDVVAYLERERRDLERKHRWAERRQIDAWTVGHHMLGEIERQRKDQLAARDRELVGIRSALIGQLHAAEAELAVLRQQVAASQKREAAIADFIDMLTSSLARKTAGRRR